jgi:hypothetical protein
MSSALLRSSLPIGGEVGLDLPLRRATARTERDPGQRVAIVGAGFGGLAAAIRLQAAGVSTVVYEARDQAGGCAYVWQQDGYTFDGGPTVITAPNCIEELFTLAGRRMEDYVELLPVHPMYRLSWEDGTAIDYDVMNGLMEREIARVAASRRMPSGSSTPGTPRWRTSRSCASSTCSRSRPRWCGCARIARSTPPSRAS